MPEALVTPSVLRWARERASLEPEDLAQKLSVKPDRILDWEVGKNRPTFRQAENLARVTHVSLGFLFLPGPPKETLPIPDLRTAGSRAVGEISVDLRDVILDALRKQDWYRDYLRAQGAETLAFVGRFGLDSRAEEIAADIIQTLAIRPVDRKGNYERFLETLIAKSEETGILVLRNGVVGHNTKRPLDVGEFRGFAIADDYAPLIFINNADAKAGQIFTLVHELAHIWLGQSGISDLTLRVATGKHQKVERLCNEVAGEVLVPSQELVGLWRADYSLSENGEEVASVFKVSTVVIGFRLAKLGLVSQKQAADFYDQEKKKWRKQSGSGGQFYYTAPVRNSKLFTAAVIRQALSHRMLLRDAGKLLGVKPSYLRTQAQKMGLEL